MNEQTAYSHPQSPLSNMAGQAGSLAVASAAAAMTAGVVAAIMLGRRRRHRPTTLSDRLRSALTEGQKGFGPAVAVMTSKGIGQGSRAATELARRFGPDILTAPERARGAADVVQRIGQAVSSRLQSDVMPRARQLQAEYTPKAQQRLAKSKEVGADLAARLQEEVLPQARGLAKDISTSYIPKAGEAMDKTNNLVQSMIASVLALPGTLLGGMFRLVRSVAIFTVTVVGLGAVILFIFAPERQQREEIFKQVSAVASGVGDFISDVRQAVGSEPASI